MHTAVAARRRDWRGSFSPCRRGPPALKGRVPALSACFLSSPLAFMGPSGKIVQYIHVAEEFVGLKDHADFFAYTGIFRFTTLSPLKKISPPLMRSRPLMQRRSVLFPQPEADPEWRGTALLHFQGKSRSVFPNRHSAS